MSSAPSPDRVTLPGPAPRAAVRAELVRTLAGFARLPLELTDFWARRGSLRAELIDCLERPAELPPDPRPDVRTDRPLSVFVSCAEHSGQIHAVNLVRELRAELEHRAAPPPTLVGLGGEPLARAGVSTLGNPVERAVMGFDGVASALPYYLKLLEDCAEHFRSARPDVAVLVDSPALHIPLGRIARRYGVKVLHFVTPQHWGWAPWRASGYARSVDRALTILPFEPAWFERRGVPVAHVGHPLQDRLARVPQDSAPPERLSLAVLPGSRARVIDLNLPWMLETLAHVRERVPALDVRVLQEHSEHHSRIAEHIAGARASDWAHVETGELHSALRKASAAFSVSGTVLLDLLHHRLPTVCIYRVAKARDTLAYRSLLCTPWFASINLLAAREVVPEFCFRGRGPLEEVAGTLERALVDPQWRAQARRGLDLASLRLGPAGACRRAALHALDLAGGA